MAEENENIEEWPGTVQLDPRFPNSNQTKHCYSAYLDYHRAVALLGEHCDAAKYFKRVFTIMCPKFWVEHWDEQRENGTFPGQINRVLMEKPPNSESEKPEASK